MSEFFWKLNLRTIIMEKVIKRKWRSNKKKMSQAWPARLYYNAKVPPVY